LQDELPQKIQTLGFKKIKPLVVCDYDSYREMIDGKKIISLDDYIKEKEKEILKSNYQSKSLKILFAIREFGISGSKDELSKMQTYYWKISDTFTMYISIYNGSYFCFGYDSSIEDYPNKYHSKQYPVIVNDKAFIIDKGTFSPHFWKNILNSLDLQYKREIILKQII
jgi:hypothetical protein